MLVFIDEAWDSGFKFDKNSSKYFTIWMVIFENDEDAEYCNKRIDLIKNELKLPKTYEFHYKNDSDRIKQEFIKKIAPYDFFYYWVVIDKSELNLTHLELRESFYNYACSLLFESVKSRLQNANIILDWWYGKAFDRNLQTYLRKKFNSYNEHRIKKVRTEDSRKNNLIELADYITSWIHREHSSKKESFLWPIKYREINVQIRPKEKSTSIS